MRLPNQRFPALRKRVNRPVIWLVLAIFSLPLISLAGCANGTPSIAWVKDWSSSFSPAESPTPTATPLPTTVPTPLPAPEAEEIKGHPGRKTAKQAATASKQAAGVANQAEGSGHGADVSLESNPGTTSAGTPATPSAATSVASVPPAAGTPTLSSPALKSSGSSGDANPANAAKLIQDIDKVEKRVDRKNLSADDSQRDILAQKLLQQAKKSLAQRDSVAASSLARKASTLLEPLPKLADSASPTAP